MRTSSVGGSSVTGQTALAVTPQRPDGPDVVIHVDGRAEMRHRAATRHVRLIHVIATRNRYGRSNEDEGIAWMRDLMADIVQRFDGR
jgi:hypothetical protein